jgi:hypothetical protein
MNVEERGHAGVDDKNDIATAATVTAIWTTERLELLAMDRRTAVPTVAAGCVDYRLVDEGRGHAANPYYSAAVVTFTTRRPRL